MLSMPGGFSIDSMPAAANVSGEYNLTDMVRVAVGEGRVVSSVECDPCEIIGVNTLDDSRVVEDILRERAGNVAG